MKKIVASVGLVALGASTLQAASFPGLTADGGKPWSISATLRGFYDDNINAAPDKADLGPYSRESIGFEVSPSLQFTWPIDQTTLSLGYTYSYKYYDKKLAGSGGHDDNTHNFNLALDHAFNERYQLKVADSFVIGQEPDLLRTGNAMTTYQRVPGNNIRNYGTIDFTGQATRLFGYSLGYANSFYMYDDTGARDNGFGEVSPSLGGLLNRLEHVGRFDTRWQVAPTTVGVLGYQYREVDYDGGEPIGGPYPPVSGETIRSDSRNSRTHYMYVGADHTFSPALSGAVRVGAEYTDYFNDPNTDTQWSPYALASVRYTYMPESYFEVGVTHDRNATDVLGLGFDGSSKNITMDQESTVVYASVNHRITPKLYGSLLGQYQNSQFNGGAFDSESENYWMAGINVEYRFTPNFSAHAGYNYDLLDSDLGDIRDMSRNRVYIGLTARY